MTQKEFNKILFAQANKVRKELEEKVLTDAGLEEVYTQENLWFECVDFNDSLLKFTASNFTFQLYIEKGKASTHIVSVQTMLKLNSRPELKHEEIEYIISNLLVAEKIINSLIMNKTLIAKSAYDVFNSYNCVRD